MALDFPSSPTNGQVYTDSATGNKYTYVSAYNYWSYTAANTLGASSNTQIIYNDSGLANGSAALTFNKTSNVVTLSNSLTVNAKIQIGAVGAYDYGNTAAIEIDLNQNTFSQVVIQNANTGNNASSDLVVTADTGNNTTDFIDLGINNSLYNQPSFNIIGGKDGYLYTSNGNLAIGTASAKEVIFHANGTTSTDRKLTINATALTVSNATGLVVNGSFGTAGQVLTSNGSALYWAAASAGVNTAAQYTWSNTQTFTANIQANGVLVSANLISTSIATGATANGATQGTAYPIVTTSVQFTTVASGTGAILPSVPAGVRIFIANDGGNNLLVYPPSGDNIDQGTTNSPITLAAGGMWEGQAINATSWTTISPDSQGSSGVAVTQGNGVVTYSVNSAFQFSWSNTQTFSNTINFTSIVNVATGAVIANSTGIWATGTVNAASHSVGTSFVANTTQVTIAGIPLSANGGTGSAGQVLTSNGATGAPYWAAAAAGVNTAAQYTWTNTHTFQNTITFSSTINIAANAVINSTAYYWVGNTTTSPTVTLANTGAFTIGNSSTTQTASTISVANSAGNVQISSGVNSINATGSINAASHTVGAATIANSTGVWTTGTVNAASHAVGTTFIANTSQVTIASIPLSANGGVGSAGQVLTSNGASGAPYWSTVAGGSVNVAAQYSWTNVHTFSNLVYLATTAASNVGIGTTVPLYKLQVNGSFAATTKSFVIDHPTKEDMKLRYGSLEGPENGVYVRGKIEGKSIIELPEYWWNLIDESTITVNLTPIGRSQDIWIQSTSSHFIHLNQPADCFFTVFAERKDVDKLVVEF